MKFNKIRIIFLKILQKTALPKLFKLLAGAIFDLLRSANFCFHHVKNKTFASFASSLRGL
jgi:hypothetical protein